MIHQETPGRSEPEAAHLAPPRTGRHAGRLCAQVTTGARGLAWQASVWVRPWMILTLAVACGTDAGEDPAAGGLEELRITPHPLEQPKTPGALFDAVVLMVDLDRPGLAHTYLKELLAAQPDNPDLLSMRDRHGSEAFHQLVDVPSLAPEAMVLLDMANAAFTEYGARFTGNAPFGAR